MQVLLPLLFNVSCQQHQPEGNSATHQKVPIDVNVSIELSSLSIEDIDPHTVLVRKNSFFRPDLVPYSNLVVVNSIDRLRIEQIEVPNQVDTIEFIEDLRGCGQYEFVEPNLKRRLDVRRTSSQSAGAAPMVSGTASTNDPYAFLQWHMTNFQVDRLSQDAQGSAITVAVLDTGVSVNGYDTPDNMTAGYDFIDNDSDPSDFHGHGTHVAGTVAQATNNNVGARGVAPNSIIMPVKVLDDDGFGYSYQIADGITFAVDRGADVINMSLGSPQSTAVESSAVAYAISNGVAVIAATGNEGNSNTILFPAAYDGVVSVGSVGLDNIVTAYSNKGPEMMFTAPGGDFYDDYNADGYVDGILQETINGGVFNYYFYEGTSMAAPHVAGGYAALMSAGFTATQVTDAFINTAIDMGSTGWDKDYGYGVVQARDAYEYLQTSAAQPELELLALEAKYQPKTGQLHIQHFNSDAAASIVCGTRQDGSQHCSERSSNPNQVAQQNSVLDVSATNFTLTLIDSSGVETDFGPFSIQEDSLLWQNVITCSTFATVSNIEANTIQNVLQVAFTTTENLRVALCGSRSLGETTCQYDWVNGSGSLSLWNISGNATLSVTDEQGCSQNLGPLPDFIQVLPSH